MRKTIECGREAASHFALAPGYRNLNHGSYGTYPIPVREHYLSLHEHIESRPDVFVRYEYRTHLLDASRAAIEDYLHAPKDTCVFVPNATTGVETVLRNLEPREGDVVIAFATVYEAFANAFTYLSQTTGLQVRTVEYTLPVSDGEICERLEKVILGVRKEGLRPRLVLFDTINTLPGVRMPFERITRICRENGVLSCIDGAHGIGQIALDMRALDPDFFVTNCHKWLYTPRGCGVLYAPVRNQHMLRSTLPTSFGFGQGFVENFSNVGTLDDSPYLCVRAALSWRALLTWRGKTGEEAIMAYGLDLARRGGKKVAEILGTEVLENEEGTLGNCAFANVRLPVDVSQIVGDLKATKEVADWIMKTMILNRNTSVNIFLYASVLWARLSAPVYLALEDFEAAGQQLREVCEDAQNSELHHLVLPKSETNCDSIICSV